MQNHIKFLGGLEDTVSSNFYKLILRHAGLFAIKWVKKFEVIKCLALRKFSLGEKKAWA
jgi:hypothetical protein